MTTEPITRPALRYYGGKWRLAPWVIAHLPPHESYVEPYAGAASVLLQKPPSRIEVYNDLDGEVVNFFRVLRDRTDELVRALALTPYARAEMLACSPEPGLDDLERARRMFVRCWQGRGDSNGKWTRGWRFQRTTHRRSWSPAEDFADVDRLYALAERFRSVQIEHSPALEVIARYDTAGTLFYCDPPYVQSTRSSRWATMGYAHELDDQGHRDLADALSRIKGMAVVSGYPSPLYDEIFEGWTVLTKSSLRNTNYPNASAKLATECLWLSPAAAGAARVRQFEGFEA